MAVRRGHSPKSCVLTLGFAAKGRILAPNLLVICSNRAVSRSAPQFSWERIQTAHNLFADAESAEHAIENVVGVDGAHDLTQFPKGLAEFGGNELLSSSLAR